MYSYVLYYNIEKSSFNAVSASLVITLNCKVWNELLLDWIVCP